MDKEVRKEEKFDKFLEELLKDSSPDYKFVKGDKDVLEIVELSLFLKGEQPKASAEFKSRLYKTLSTEFSKELKEHRNTSKMFFGSVTLVTVLSLFFMLFRPVGTLYAPVRISKQPHDDIVKVASYSFGNRKTLRILYNEKNRAILYWPIGQFAIFQ